MLIVEWTGPRVEKLIQYIRALLHDVVFDLISNSSIYKYYKKIENKEAYLNY